MAWLLETFLSLILGPISFISNWVDELRACRDDDPTTRTLRSMKRSGTQCLLGALVLMWLLLVFSSLPVSAGASGQAVAQVLDIAVLATTCLAAMLLSAALLCFYRAWRIESV